MTAENEDQLDGQLERLRSARMPFETTVLMSRGSESRPTTLIDISATGASLRRPLDWSGVVGQEWILDMIFGQELHIHLEATVVRIAERDIGFSYSSIPEDKQVPLWNLLGRYADTQEQWAGD